MSRSPKAKLRKTRRKLTTRSPRRVLTIRTCHFGERLRTELPKIDAESILYERPNIRQIKNGPAGLKTWIDVVFRTIHKTRCGRITGLELGRDVRLPKAGNDGTRFGERSRPFDDACDYICLSHPDSMICCDDAREGFDDQCFAKE